MNVEKLIEEKEAQIRILYKEIEKLKTDSYTALFSIDLSVYRKELGTKLYYCLLRNGCSTVGDIVIRSRADLLNFKAFGAASLKQLEDWMKQKNLEFLSD